MLFSQIMFAQELNIEVKIVAPSLQIADPQIFTTLENQIEDFLNNTSWTDDEYENFEKIDGSLNITIKQEYSASSFSADFFFQTLRPVYNSNYVTQLINYIDKNVPLNYTNNQPIRKSIDSYIDNLSSLLTFYAVTIIAFDYDSFSPAGGEKYFQQGQNILNSIPPAVMEQDDNWSNKGKKRNRYYLIENVLNPRVRNYRQAFYEYHRQGLDGMAEDSGKSTAIMTGALTAIDQVHKDYPNSMIVQMFVESKRDEIIEIYKDASRGEKSKVYEMMVRMDPSNANKYSAIK